MEGKTIQVVLNPSVVETIEAAARSQGMTAFWQETVVECEPSVVFCDWGRTKVIRVMPGGMGFFELQWRVDDVVEDIVGSDLSTLDAEHDAIDKALRSRS